MIGPRLFDYIIAVGKKHEFAVDRISLLPDHMHMSIEGVPEFSVEDYALAIMNNTQYWMTKNYAGVLKECLAAILLRGNCGRVYCGAGGEVSGD